MCIVNIIEYITKLVCAVAANNKKANLPLRILNDKKLKGNTRCGTRTHDPQVKSLMLYQLS